MEYNIGDDAEKVLQNIELAQSWYNDKQYGSLDNIIMGLCFGEVNPKPGGEIWNKVEDWVLGKVKLESGEIMDYVKAIHSGAIKNMDNVGHGLKIMWNDWNNILKEDFYKEFIRIYKKVYYCNLVCSMRNYIGDVSLDRYLEKWVKDENGLNDGSYEKMCKPVDEDKAYKDLDYLQLHVTRKSWDVKIEIELNKDFAGGLGVRNIKINDLKISKQCQLEATEVEFISLTELDKCFDEKGLDDFIGCLCSKGFEEIEAHTKPKSIRTSIMYDNLLDLYTGYLKYGSVDNYKAYCMSNS